MTLWNQTLAWLTSPGNWSGAGSIPERLVQHLGVSAVALVCAAVITLPVGIAIGHSRRGSGGIGAITGAARSIPTLGLLTLFGLAFGIGLTAPILALIVLAVPSLLAGAYAGIQSIDPEIPAAARAIGMSGFHVVRAVEIPLALPVIVGGLRSATLQIVSTATLAAYTADIGLGRYLFSGLKTRDYPQMLGGAILVIALALLLDVLFAFAQRAASHHAHPISRDTQPTRTADAH